jgi:hypothetical protein
MNGFGLISVVVVVIVIAAGYIFWAHSIPIMQRPRLKNDRQQNVNWEPISAWGAKHNIHS